MKNTVFKILVFFIVSYVMIACNDYSENKITKENQLIDEFLANSRYNKSGVLESSSDEIMRNAILELTDFMKEISSNKKVITELYESINNHYYKENLISMNDLIYFNSSEAYKKASVSENVQGSLKKLFLKIDSKKYPNLHYIIKNSKNVNLKNQSNNFYDIAKIFFYIPYLIDDNNNKIEPYQSITYVPAVIDAENGLGYKLNTSTNTFENVITNDDYANKQLTIIIQPEQASLMIAPDGDIFGGGGNSGGGNGVSSNQYTGNCTSLEPKPHNGYIRQVFIGHARINNKHQYDHWISFTGNGGGSEIRIGRLSSRESIGIDSLGNINVNQWSNFISVTFSRRDIRRKKRKWLGSIWHKNWQCRGEIHEELFGVWEEDTEGDILFDQTVKWKDTTLFSINATIHNRSKDEIIRKWTREKTEFFTTNLLDQGGGTWAGEYSFSDRNWAVYDRGTNFCYTMPHRWVNIGNNLGYQ